MIFRPDKKIWIIGACFLVAVGVTLAIVLPLTVFKSKGDKETKQSFKGSDVLDEVPLIDGHNDLPYNLYSQEKNQLENFNFNSDLRQNPKWQISSSFTDIPRLKAGKLGGQFWVAFVSCSRNYKDAVERTLEQIDVIKRLVKANPNDMMYVTEADQIMEAFKQKKIASMIEIEGGHSIDSRLSVLRLYYELGVRCMTLTHSCNLPWADASPIDDSTTAVKKNLTSWGLEVIQEMNRLGMIIDISHVSEGVMLSVLENSKAQVIFSHSSVYALHNHHRNVKDNVLHKVKEKKGLVMINFYSGFIGGDNKIDDVIRKLSLFFRSIILNLAFCRTHQLREGPDWL
jgi:membrane dipeptidase